MYKEDVVHIYTMDYSSTIIKNETLPFATTWMDLEGIMLSEVSQTKINSNMISHVEFQTKKNSKQPTLLCKKPPK